MAAKKKSPRKKPRVSKLSKRPARTLKGLRKIKKAMEPYKRRQARAAEKFGLKWSVKSEDHPWGIEFSPVTIKLPHAAKILGIELKDSRSPKGDVAIIHRSTVRKTIERGLPWQTSYYDDFGPIYHSEEPTLQKAFEDASSQGYHLTQMLYK